MEASIWDQILSRIETKVNRHSFYTWFKPTSFVLDSGGSISVRVPNQLFKDWLGKHYSMVLSEALTEVHRPDTSLVFLPEGVSGRLTEARPAVIAEVERQEVRARSRPPRRVGSLNERYTFDTFIVGPVEPVRPRRLPGRGRSAVALVQPAVHLRRSRPRARRT